jgi:hypothetical protein
MGPVPVVVVDVPTAADDQLEMASVDDQHPIGAFASDGADEPLVGGVGTRSMDRCTDDPDALRAEHLVEGGRELGGPVPDEELDALVALMRSLARFLACWTTQTPVGRSVIPVPNTLRVSSSMKNRT